ncbi:hypothetical protein AVEN_24613-1 [Araneus ventricosus]|uniref:Uncharacterized protein n=1 Tax=Araneus ventricosus TaxID=182803 RepID=A0A4Y2IJ79_ARAVE|nr:hypothetical protein AVEN_24613-1 [Araneus ventricosus]
MDWKWWNSKELKIPPPKKKTSADWGSRCEDSGRTKDLPTLGPRFEARNKTRNLPCGGRSKGWEEFCDFEPCLKTNFGSSVNDLPNFSTKISGMQTSCWDKWLSLSFS